jgi:energy-coupling factor transporter ATP-binding protein EcfA2
MSDTPKFRVDSVTLEGWGPIQKPVTVRLSDPVTVLVGRNGSGKSVLLEGIAEALYARADVRPKAVTFEAILPDNSRIRCTRTPTTEVGWDHDNQEIWAIRGQKLESGTEMPGLRMATVGGTDPILMGLLSAPTVAVVKAWPEVKVVSALPARLQPRRGVLLTRPEASLEHVPLWYAERGDDDLGDLAGSLHLWHRERPAKWDEIRHVACRAGVAQDLSIVEFGEPGKPVSQARVYVDGTDIGLASDGTFRALRLLFELVGAPEGAVLLIDQPEDSLHPGLLSRVMAEVEAYRLGKTVIVATHSSVVVDRTAPGALRLVEAGPEGLTVIELTDEQKTWVGDYLEDGGTASELVFGDLIR